MNKTGKHFVKDEMLETIKRTFQKSISDKPGRERSDLDSVMSAYAVFSFKYPSLLQFDQARRVEMETKKENLKNLFKVNAIPCDTYMRERVDLIDPRCIEGAFSKLLSLLQRQKKLETFEFLEGRYLVSVDATGGFSSSKVFCENCCQKTLKGKPCYYHQLYSAAIVHPDLKTVLPLAPEPIIKQDNATKNDCEREAMKRWVKKFRKTHPFLNATIVADGLSSNGAFIQTLQEHKLGYILVCKDKDHKHLLDHLYHNAPTILKEGQDTYMFLNHVPINATHENIKVNVVRYETTNAKTHKKSTWMFVSDMFITSDNVHKIVKGGRSRWKIENETFNTLKNQGYHFEHNFGHGHKNLSTNLSFLMMLSFLVDQILEFVHVVYKKIRLKLGSRRALFEHIRVLIKTVIFCSFEQLYSFILDPPRAHASQLMSF